MADYFLDSSALVKRYVQETGTAWVRGLTRRNARHDLYVARITAVEVTSAIARRRGGRGDLAAAHRLLVRRLSWRTSLGNVVVTRGVDFSIRSQTNPFRIAVQCPERRGRDFARSTTARAGRVV